VPSLLGPARPVDDAFVSARSVSIIGSFRQFYDEVLSAWRSFAAAGWRITSPRGSAIIQPGIPFVRFVTDPAEWDDATVQTATLHRILRADLTYVIAPRGYLGRTTCYELGRLIQADQPVYFSARPNDLPIAVPDDHVVSVPDLLRRLSENCPQPLFVGSGGPNTAWEYQLVRRDYLDL
jgi:hypothetical protein